MMLTRRRADALIDATIAAATRETRWEFVDEVPLRFDAFHPQGMVRVDGIWWLSTVDIGGRRGLLMAADREGRLLGQVTVGDQERFHPGGIVFAGAASGVAAADYRPASTSVVHRVVPGQEQPPEPVFA